MYRIAGRAAEIPFKRAVIIPESPTAAHLVVKAGVIRQK